MIWIPLGPIPIPIPLLFFLVIPIMVYYNPHSTQYCSYYGLLLVVILLWFILVIYSGWWYTYPSEKYEFVS